MNNKEIILAENRLMQNPPHTTIGKQRPYYQQKEIKTNNN